jgi:hypothetical protein
MALFNINGKSADSLQEALEICREIWSNSKSDAVLEQKKEALSKPTPLDRERAEAGVSVKLGN